MVERLSAEKYHKAKETVVLKTVNTLEGWPEVKGYDFEKDFDFKKFMDSFLHTGFQATHLGAAINIAKEMQENDAKIFLGFTSNVVSSGLREVVKYLVKNKLVHVLCTTAGGIEEDIIKCFKPFVLGNFRANDPNLREEGINRTGNIFIPNDRYGKLEEFLMPILERLYKQQKETGKIINSYEFVWELGKEINDENSICYWAWKNKIKYFCPALTDGSIGDMIYFFKYENPDFKIDITDDVVEVTNEALNAEKTGLILIGGSLPKHWLANANLFRDGADYAIYITTAIEGDGSNAGARPQEAQSWGKIKSNAKYVTIQCEASIVLPLLVAGAFRN